MSTIIAVKGPEGIVLASESRRVLCVSDPRELGASGAREYMTWDGDMKLLAFEGESHRWVGIALYGVLSNSVESLPLIASEIEGSLPSHRLPVSEYANLLSDLLVQRAKRPAPIPFTMSAIVAGYDDGVPEGRVFVVEVPASPEPVEHHAGTVGLTYGGQRDIIDRILQGYDSLLSVEDADTRTAVQTPLPLATMSLPKCLFLATLLLNTTIAVQGLVDGLTLQGSAGPLDVAVITAADGLRFVQRKKYEPFGPKSPVEMRRYDTSVRPAIVTAAPADIARMARYTVRV